jgi:conjugal transfer pilus assembly protein TraK
MKFLMIVGSKVMRIFFSLCLLICTSAFGLQTLQIKPNETVTAKISAAELSRIFVEGDRIQSVRGIDNTYAFKSDRVTGDVFLRPMPEYQHQPFTVHLTTESGKTVSLLLVASGVPAQNIKILLQGTKNKQAAKWEVGLPYEKTLTSLMVAMVNDAKPEGFEDSPIKDAKQSLLGDVATVRLQKVFSGDRLQGEVFVVTNRKKTPIVLTEAEFYRSGTRAITLLEQVLPAKAQTMLYVIRDNQD